MEEPAQPFAWQPLTFGGVARFAYARRSRLFLVQFLAALIAAGTVIWCLGQAWFPVISSAIKQLPDQGELRARKLSWLGEEPVRLADNRFLALAVDLKHTGTIRSPAHLQLEFGLSDIEAISLFGYAWLPYPAQTIGVNRPRLEPWWGAWSPALLAITAGIVAVGLMLVWAALATLYSFPVWLLGFFANRELDLRQSWNLAGAALLPGALFMSGAIVLYGLGLIEVIGLLVAIGLHLIVGWVYVIGSPFKARFLAGFASSRPNPFRSTKAKKDSGTPRE
jgi:hypothetical protein